MRRWLWIAIGLFLLLIAGSALALYFFDAEKLRGPLQEQASAALGRDVTLGKISLAIFPLPAVRIANVRISGPKPADPPLAEIAELRLRVAVLPLLAKKVELRALELDSPRVNIPFDKDGKPILPGTKKPEAGKPAEKGAAKPEAGKPGGAPAGGLALAVDRIAIHDADVVAGPWKVEHANIDGHLALDGSGAFKYSANLPGLANLRGGEVELANLLGTTPQVDAHGEFSAALGDVRKRFALTEDVTGTASGEYAATLNGGEIKAASASVDVPDLLLRNGGLVVSGPARGHAVLGESYSFDLSDARVEQTNVFAKPKHTTLSVTGKLGKEASLAALRDALLKIGENELPLQLELAKKPMKVHLGKTSLDLGKLRELLPPDKPQLSGRLAVDGFDVELQPLRVLGNATLDGVETQLGHGPISISGPLRGKGETVGVENAVAIVGGQKIGISASYALDSGTITADYGANKAELGSLVEALAGRKELDGTLNTNGHVEMRSAGISTLGGGGKIAIQPGRIQGFSLAKQVMGSLAALPALALAAKGKDISKYEQEEFDHLTADYTISDGRVHTDNLELAYQDATAYLQGSVGLVDRALDLTGKVVLTKKADAEFAGTGRAKERVIPISHVGGTYDSPKIELDQKTLASLAYMYVGDEKMRKKLDKALGPGGADAVEGVLDGLLGGGNNKKKK
ncbi:MAG TPA: AsmA family protein [Myxococcota bacterium]|nr:AsmA family protein [Myxococcota bacterium]